MEYVVTNHIAYLNNGPMVKYLFPKHSDKGGERFKLSHYHLKLLGWSGLSSQPSLILAS